MASSMKKLGALVCLTLAGLSLSASAQSKDPDRIRIKDRKLTIKAEIIHDGYDKVIYKKAGRKAKEVSPADVLEIKYGGFPTAYNQGLANEKKADSGSGNTAELFENAANSFDLAAGGDGLRKAIKALCLYRSALCRMKIGLIQRSRLGEAATKFEAYLTEFPKHRSALQGTLYMAKCFQISGDYAKALATLQDLDKKVLQGNIPPIWEARSKTSQIQVLLANGKTTEAVTICSNASRVLADVSGDDKGTSLLRMKVEFLKGRCDTVGKNYSTAISYFQKLMDKARTDPLYKVIGLVGMGEAYFAKAKAKKDAKALRLAQLSFSQAYVFDFSDSEYSAMSLYFNGEVHLALGGEDAALAKDYFLQVIKQFPLSDWTSDARKRIK